MFGDWPRAADPFVAYPIPPIPPLTGNEVVIAEAPVGAVTVIVQWQGPSVRIGPGATYAADVFSDAVNQPGSAFQQRLVDSGLFQDIGRQLLHAQSHRSDHHQRADDARQAAGRDRPRSTTKSRASTASGTSRPKSSAEVKAQRAVNSAFGRERASGLRAHHRVLVERRRHRVLLRLRRQHGQRRRRRTSPPTRATTSSASPT